ncbi:hypothetical protein T439DRAFT_326203 [Meredithblackwellia eburnea MCA 4105]
METTANTTKDDHEYHVQQQMAPAGTAQFWPPSSFADDRGVVSADFSPGPGEHGGPPNAITFHFGTEGTFERDVVITDGNETPLYQLSSGRTRRDLHRLAPPGPSSTQPIMTITSPKFLFNKHTFYLPHLNLSTTLERTSRFSPDRFVRGLDGTQYKWARAGRGRKLRAWVCTEAGSGKLVATLNRNPLARGIERASLLFNDTCSRDIELLLGCAIVIDALMVGATVALAV